MCVKGITVLVLVALHILLHNVTDLQARAASTVTQYISAAMILVQMAEGLVINWAITQARAWFEAQVLTGAYVIYTLLSIADPRKREAPNTIFDQGHPILNSSIFLAT